MKLESFYNSSAQAKTDERGYLIVESTEQAKRLAKDFKKYPGIKIDLENANSLFSLEIIGPQRLFIKSLDLDGVKTARFMFHKATIQHLGKIENATSLEDAANMFSLAMIAKLPSIECPALKSYANMLEISNEHNTIPPKKLVIGGIDVNPLASEPSGNNFYLSKSYVARND